MERVAKLLGEDMELGNFFEAEEGPATWSGSGERAARALLDEVDGIQASRPRAGWTYGGAWGGGIHVATEGSSGSASTSQDWGRLFLPRNGGSAYIDLAHLECCIPEVTSAWDATAAHHAMLQLAAEALAAANEHAEQGRYRVLANNSDRQGNSYGSHLNVLVTRTCWDDLFRRKMHPLLVLAAYQVSSIVLTGQGKVGSENRRRPVPFQIAQRADFFESLTGPQTTYSRPIVNSRDEALCGDARDGDLARLHCIFYDNTLSHTATLLKFGGLQIALAMLEAGHVDLDLALDDPVAAVLAWSHDPDLETRCKLTNGDAVTAVELQLRFVEAARRCGDAGHLDTVPRADELLALQEETLHALRDGEQDVAAARLDWVMKRQIVERALARRGDLGWDAPEIRHLDLVYASLDRDEGLYYAFEAAGATVPVVSESEIRRFLDEPPDDTRAWMRAMLLRGLDPRDVERVDWDEIVTRVELEDGTTRRVTLSLDDPRRFTRAQMESCFRGADGAGALLQQIVRSELEMEEQDPAPLPARH